MSQKHELEMRKFKITTGDKGNKTFEIRAEEFLVYNGAVTFYRTINGNRLHSSVVFGAWLVEEVIDEDRAGE